MTLDSPISRLFTSTAASLLALLLCLAFGSLAFASAAEPVLDSAIHIEEPIERRSGLDLIYEPEFTPFDRSIIGRAPNDPKPELSSLDNNGPDARNLGPGKTVCYVIDKKTLLDGERSERDITGDESTDGNNEGNQNSRRAEAKTVYISANTCNGPAAGTKDGKPLKMPQLTLYVSTTNKTQCPDATNFDEKNSALKEIPFVEGAVMYTLNATDTVYLSIAAPNLTRKEEAVWKYEVAISFDEYYHSYVPNNGSVELLWLDSDSKSALLVSRVLSSNSTETQTIMKRPPPYEIYIGNSNLKTIDGLRHSACGLKNSADIWASNDKTGQRYNQVTMGMTLRGPGPEQLPKQQFLLEGLNSSTNYTGILVKMPTKSNKRQSTNGRTIGGGGIVFQSTDFETSSGTNCMVVTDLTFCNETQYAVPGNNKKYNNTMLAKEYDDYARTMYANFEKVLAQVACEAPPESAYSLARTCDDCREAYKRWLCTVSIPRCEDVMGGSNISIIRNAFHPFPNGTKLSADFLKGQTIKPANNASRNAFIDQTIKPGPYREMLPCEDLCYDVVQSCPAQIGFSCPQPGFQSFDVSYGQRGTGVTCNYPGEARTKISAAGVLSPSVLLLSAVPLMVWLGL
ncbi:hypothetical protein NCS55_01111400 [Fusarium keratoplasticum]|nr:hypothetical protein NCS55_01111400 [Fusarium keratoplasticum]